MSHSIRLIYRNMKGRSRQNYNWDSINRRSSVIITAAEWMPVSPPNPEDVIGRPHLGEANVYVTNIGPHDDEGGGGGVEFHLHVDYDTPLNVQVTITVLDEFEDFKVVN